MAKAASVGSRTVENDEDDNGAPFQSVEEYLAWRVANRSVRSASGDGTTDLRERKLLAEAIKIEAEGRIKELDARVKEGELVNRKVIESWLAKFVSATAQKLEAVPELVVPELPLEVRAVSHQILTEAMRMLLSELADMPAELWADEAVKESQ